MRAFLWVSGALGGAVALAFALALLREAQSARAALPPALLAGEALTETAAVDAFRAWAEALPPAPVPLTTQYAMRAEFLGDAAGVRRAEMDLGIVNGNLGSLRLDVKERSAIGDAALETMLDGALVLDGNSFWAWGSLPINPEFEKVARGKVVRLPVELLTAFFQEGLLWLEDSELPLPAGMQSMKDLQFGELFHPARLATLLMRGSFVTALALEEGSLRVTVQGGSSALALLGRMGAGIPGLESAAQMPLLLDFDADTGELLSAEFALTEGQGFFRIESVHREAVASAAAFRYPEGMTVFDLAPLAQMGLGLMRKARADHSDSEF
ncbi:MAG: hypothetical protein O3A20_00680 [Planctomycetota bacterium]|nr:hypothetical protein [Planctomycetota bacterium]